MMYDIIRENGTKPIIPFLLFPMINKTLFNSLLKMIKRDQQLRKCAVASGRLKDKLIIKKMDESHHKWLRNFIEKYGYPNNQLVGKRGMHAFWLLIQHQDNDLKLQESCLVNCNFTPKDKAYLTDRVLVAQGKKQIYGTQFYRNAKGQLIHRPIRDKAGLNVRRQLMGLKDEG